MIFQNLKFLQPKAAFMNMNKVDYIGWPSLTVLEALFLDLKKLAAIIFAPYPY